MCDMGIVLSISGPHLGSCLYGCRTIQRTLFTGRSSLGFRVLGFRVFRVQSLGCWALGSGCLGFRVPDFGGLNQNPQTSTQRAQYPSIKEYGLNYIVLHIMI